VAEQQLVVPRVRIREEEQLAARLLRTLPARPRLPQPPLRQRLTVDQSDLPVGVVGEDPDDVARPVHAVVIDDNDLEPGVRAVEQARHARAYVHRLIARRHDHRDQRRVRLVGCRDIECRQPRAAHHDDRQNEQGPEPRQDREQREDAQWHHHGRPTALSCCVAARPPTFPP
jgi:hypothetical protein